MGSVTEQVFNSTSSFGGNRFLFVSEDGTVSGWRPALATTGLIPAEKLVSASASNVYKGAALGNIGGHDYLYAANFKAGTGDVHEGDAGTPSLSGSFTDPGLPSGYAPFNVQNLDGSLYVTYALQNASKDNDVTGAGQGFVDQYTLNGDFVARVASGGNLECTVGLGCSAFFVWFCCR
ncbi:MAG: TIGR03118 family protein [Nitrosomonadales bacterium SCN 54-20]|nr:MAG: TIGR03118 family protein [Nitrosomonadales bacterium SCN 54-20]